MENYYPTITKAHFLARHVDVYEKEKERYGKFYIVNSMETAYEWKQYSVEGCTELYIIEKEPGVCHQMIEVPWIDAILEEGVIPEKGMYFTRFRYYNSIYEMWDFREKSEMVVREVTALRPNLFDIFTENERYKCCTGNSKIEVKNVKANFPVVYVGKTENINGLEFGRIYFVTSMTRTLESGSYTIEGFDGEFNWNDFREIPTYYVNYFEYKPKEYVDTNYILPRIGTTRWFSTNHGIEETLDTKGILDGKGKTIQRVTALKTNMFDVVTGEARYFFYF